MSIEGRDRLAKLDGQVRDEEVSGFRLSNIETEDVRFLINDNTALRKRVEELVAALEKYGRHGEFCINKAVIGQRFDCDCGLRRGAV